MTANPQRGPDVLVVDDQPEIRSLITAILEDAGFTVREASNGADAMVYLQTQPHPQIILLDLMMPVMNGWEFRQWQRQMPTLALIPVIIVSAIATFPAQLRALDAQALLPKPFQAADVLALVQQYLEPPPPLHRWAAPGRPDHPA